MRFNSLFRGRIALYKADGEVLYEVASLGKTYVEIGTLFGGSAVIAGLAGCEVFCIDPLDGYYSAKHAVKERVDKWTGLVPSEEIVRENWESAGLDPKKLHIYAHLHPPWPEEINRAFDVGLIDGTHQVMHVIRDYEGMAPRVKYLMLHDIDKAAVRVVYNMALESGDWETYIPKAKEPSVMGVLKRRSI
jgi:hypothetical protein